MPMPLHLRAAIAPLMALAAACGERASPVDPQPPTPPPIPTPVTLAVGGLGAISARYTAEVWVQGNYAYTTTWGTRTIGGVGRSGNMVYIWDVRPAAPALVDSVQVANATTIGDVQVTADGRWLVVCTEQAPGTLVTYDLADPVKPRLVSTFTSPKITRGIHTAEVQDVGGGRYAFASVNPGSTHPARLMIVDLSDPANPRETSTTDITGSFVHDVFVRDGLLFMAQWDNGMVLFDIGGGGRGGTPAAPVRMGSIGTVGGNVHNVWWLQDGTNKRYAFIGEEGPATLFSSSSGDIHVVDITDPAAMREVAFFTVAGAGTHNFAVDEAAGFLYAAYYNGGVQVLDVRGDLSTCTAAQKAADGRCNLKLMGRLKATALLDRGQPVFVWGVHLRGGALYASDMNNGLWKVTPLAR